MAKNNNLLLLGAGYRGRVVKETAAAMGIFDKIDFLDDNVELESVIGQLDNFEDYVAQYSYAFPTFGDSNMRMSWIEKLEESCFIVPALIHPTAYLSPTVTVYMSAIVEPRAVLQTGCIVEKGCIIGAGAVIDHDSFISYGCHVDSGAVVQSRCIMTAHTKVKSGCVFAQEDSTSAIEFLKSRGLT